MQRIRSDLGDGLVVHIMCEYKNKHVNISYFHKDLCVPISKKQLKKINELVEMLLKDDKDQQHANKD